MIPRSIQRVKYNTESHRITEWPGLGGASRVIKLQPPCRAGPPTSPFTRPGCPVPHPAWPWTPPGTGHLQPLWAACSSTSNASKCFISYWNFAQAFQMFLWPVACTVHPQTSSLLCCSLSASKCCDSRILNVQWNLMIDSEKTIGAANMFSLTSIWVYGWW